jgi:hypothetical protein
VQVAGFLAEGALPPADYGRPRASLLVAFAAFRGVDAGRIAAAAATPAQIPEALRQAREAAVAEALRSAALP